MNTKLLFLLMWITVGLTLSSCIKDDEAESIPEFGENESSGGDNQPNIPGTSNGRGQNQNQNLPTVPSDPGDTADEVLVVNSQTVNYENAITIVYSSTGVEINNPFTTSGVSIVADGGHVVVTAGSVEGLNYVLQGETSDGSFKLYGEKKYGLILNGVGLQNPEGSAINIQNKKKCMITLVDQTVNRLIDGTTYTFYEEEDMKGAFFSEGNVEISGTGTLEIRGKYKHAFAVDGSLLMSAGKLHVKEALSDGIHTNDEITLTGGEITIRATGEGIESESETDPIEITGGVITVATTGEKSHAIQTGQNVLLDSEDQITLTVYGNASKGWSVTGNMTVENAQMTIYTAGDSFWEDDESDITSCSAIKCEGQFVMNGGSITALSTGTGGKGISADSTIILNGGTITITTTGERYVYDMNNDASSKAIKGDQNVWVNGGSITVYTYQEEAEGLESKDTLFIMGGELVIYAYDDCINAKNHIQIDGGAVFCESGNNDGIDSNGTMTITGGTVISLGCFKPEGAFDCDNRTFTISGGTVIGLGGDHSFPSTLHSIQRTIMMSYIFKVSNIHIESVQNAAGILTFEIPSSYSRAFTFFFSSPEIEGNTAYHIYSEGTITGGTSLHGLYEGAIYSGMGSRQITTENDAGSVTRLSGYSIL